MTGVHWLLAHCSVLKVRGLPCLGGPAPLTCKRPPAQPATLALRTETRAGLRQVATSSHVRDGVPIQGFSSFPGFTPGTSTYRTAAHQDRQQGGGSPVGGKPDEMPAPDLEGPPGELLGRELRSGSRSCSPSSRTAPDSISLRASPFELAMPRSARSRGSHTRPWSKSSAGRATSGTSSGSSWCLNTRSKADSASEAKSCA